MELKAENTMRIRELESEFSDERIDELFRAKDPAQHQTRLFRGMALRRRIFRAVMVLTIIVACGFLALLFFSPMVVKGVSMEMTLESMDCVIVSEFAYSFRAGVNRDHVIAYERAGIGDEADSGVVRVIGVPEDFIEIVDGSVYRNGERLVEPYVLDGWTSGNVAQFMVPAGQYFVLGDNRQNSIDSRDSGFGLIAADEIRGKIVYRLLPISRTGKVL